MKVYIEERVLFVWFIFTVVLLFLYVGYKEDAANLNYYKSEIKRLNIEVVEMQNTIISLRNENQKLRNDFNQFKKATGDILEKFILKEALWGLIGRPDMRLACGILKNSLVGDYPGLLDLPC